MSSEESTTVDTAVVQTEPDHEGPQLETSSPGEMKPIQVGVMSGVPEHMEHKVYCMYNIQTRLVQVGQ